MWRPPRSTSRIVVRLSVHSFWPILSSYIDFLCGYKRGLSGQWYHIVHRCGRSALTAQNRARLWHPQTILVVREKHTMLPHRFDRMWHVSWPELVVWMQKFSLKYISGRLSFGRVDPRPKRNAT